ncbi:MAG: DUF6266 family protein [Bacteroidota bacterium]
MGIQKNGLLGTFYNKTGAVVGRRYRGINVITGLPRISNKEATPAQKEQQFKIGALTEMLSYLAEEVNIGFKKYKKKGHPVSLAFSYNFSRAFIVLPRVEKILEFNGDDVPVTVLDFQSYILLDFPKMVITRGDIFSPDCPSIEIAENGNFTCSWMTTPECVYNWRTDLVTLVIWDDTQKKSIHFRCMANRASLSFTEQLPQEFMGGKLHGYLFCSTADYREVGESVYLPIQIG